MGVNSIVISNTGLKELTASKWHAYTLVTNGIRESFYLKYE
jgi:hypothetical protein